MEGLTRRTDTVWFRALVALGILVAVVLASMATANEPPADGVGNVQVIEGWRFPAIPDGITSFKTPFVFTPPGS